MPLDDEDVLPLEDEDVLPLEDEDVLPLEDEDSPPLDDEELSLASSFTLPPQPMAATDAAKKIRSVGPRRWSRRDIV